MSAEKIRDFISPYISVEFHRSGDTTEMARFLVPFINCGPEHFHNIDLDTLNPILRDGLCPDLDKLRDHWIVSGSYADSDYTYFTVKIMKCNPAKNVNCKTEIEVEQFLSSYYF